MKKKGFTMVELLGVIIVVALIAVIAVPMVINVIAEARREAFKDSVYQAFSEIEYYLVKHNLKEIPEEGIEVKEMEFKKNEFTMGKLILGENNVIKAVNVSDGRYCAIGEKDTLEVYDGECDISIPTCEITGKSKMGVGGYYRENPTMKMKTQAVKSGYLLYGIGLRENYDYRVEGIGNVGIADYKVEGTESTFTVKCYVQNVSGMRGSNETEVLVDRTEPTNSDFTYSVNGKTLTLVANGIDNESGISRYQFSIDNGKTWTNVQESNIYVYEKLEPIIYTVKVRVYNGTYVEGEENLYRDSESKRISMAELKEPSYTSRPSGWTIENVEATVHFEKDGAWLIKANQDVTSNIEGKACSNVYNGEYTCEGESTLALKGGIWYQVSGNPTLTYKENGTLIAQVADGMHYKGGSVYTITNIDREKPVAYVKEASVSAGQSGWYKAVSLMVGRTSGGASGIGKVQYCITTGERCEPNTETRVGTAISLSMNATPQRMCGRVISGAGVASEVVCSGTYKVDTSAPTGSWTINGNTAQVTCSDNYGVNPNKAGQTWTLSGSSNVTLSYVCEDLAGNQTTTTHTYKYNSCKTGSNTCSYGCDTVWDNCASQTQKCNTVQDPNNCVTYSCTLYKSCRHCTTPAKPGFVASDCSVCKAQGRACAYISQTSVQCGSIAESGCSTSRHESCGTETVSGSACNNASSKHCTQYGTKQECHNECQGGNVQTNCSSCKYGSNTCAGGFDF